MNSQITKVRDLKIVELGKILLLCERTVDRSLIGQPASA